MFGKSAKDGSSRPKGSVSSMRHLVRDLRAKVRKLLPKRDCQHYRNRNERVGQISKKKKEWGSVHSSGNWRTGKADKEEWFNEDGEAASKEFFFQELTAKQIGMIKEDKCYYLGEHNVQHFEQFLEKELPKGPPPGPKSHKSITLDQLCSRAPSCLHNTLSQQWGCRPSPDHSQPLPKGQRNSATSLQYRPSPDSKTSTRLLPITAKQFDNRSRMEEIEERQRYKQACDRAELDLKMNKGQILRREMTYKQCSKIKAGKEREQVKQKLALKKRAILSKKGEINKLNSELRMIFMQKRENHPKKDGQHRVTSNRALFEKPIDIKP